MLKTTVAGKAQQRQGNLLHRRIPVTFTGEDFAEIVLRPVQTELLSVKCASESLSKIMIQSEKQNNAFAALNAVLVAARKLANDQRPHELFAQVLDIAEYLPRLMADDRDQTEAFRSNLATLAEIDPAFNFAVERFDKDDLGQW